MTLSYASIEQEDPATDTVARRVAQHALAAPADHLSDVWSWHAHVPFAYALMAIHRPALSVELGVHKGDSFLTMCRGALDHGVDGRVVGVDGWEGDAHAGYYDGDEIYASVNRALSGDLATVGATMRCQFDVALSEFDDGTIDLLHIDGLHTYEAVRHDYETWRPKLSERSMVLFHDTNVRRDDFGVWKLWAELTEQCVGYEFPYGNGLGVLVTGSEPTAETRLLLAALCSDVTVDGIDLRLLLEVRGLQFENAGRADWVTNVLDETRSELQRERDVAAAEIKRLNEELQSERAAAEAEIVRLNQEHEQLTQAVAAGRAAMQSGEPAEVTIAAAETVPSEPLAAASLIATQSYPSVPQNSEEIARLIAACETLQSDLMKSVHAQTSSGDRDAVSLGEHISELAQALHRLRAVEAVRRVGAARIDGAQNSNLNAPTGAEDIPVSSSDNRGKAEILRLEAELRDLHAAAELEISRLNKELTDVRHTGQAEIDRLTQEAEAQRIAATAEIARLTETASKIGGVKG